MADETHLSDMPTDLHLPDLSIRAFRGIDDLRVPRLGRVTLVVGENGIGKTTLIEAVRVYASRGNVDTLGAILAERKEFHPVKLDRSSSAINWSPLFFGRDPEQVSELSIGPSAADQRLQIEADTLWLGNTLRTNLANPGWEHSSPATTSLRIGLGHCNLTVGNDPPVDPRSFRRLPVKAKQDLPRAANTDQESTPTECLNLGPSVIDTSMIGRLWPRVVLTDREDRILEALRLVYGPKVERVTVVTLDDRADRSSVRNQVLVKIKGTATPVSIQSLGDGAVRTFGVGLCLAASREGFLTLDEAGIGLHHTVLHPFWSMVLNAAEHNDVQVIATTHSWDSVCGFAKAIANSSNDKGVLVRLERHQGDLRAVEYSAEDLSIAATEGIEVR